MGMHRRVHAAASPPQRCSIAHTRPQSTRPAASPLSALLDGVALAEVALAALAGPLGSRWPPPQAAATATTTNTEQGHARIVVGRCHERGSERKPRGN